MKRKGRGGRWGNLAKRKWRKKERGERRKEGNKLENRKQKEQNETKRWRNVITFKSNKMKSEIQKPLGTK